LVKPNPDLQKISEFRRRATEHYAALEDVAKELAPYRYPKLSAIKIAQRTEDGISEKTLEQLRAEILESLVRLGFLRTYQRALRTRRRVRDHLADAEVSPDTKADVTRHTAGGIEAVRLMPVFGVTVGRREQQENLFVGGNPNLHDAPMHLPFRVEMWEPSDQHVRWVVAGSTGVGIDQAAFDVAVASYPGQRFTLRKSMLVVSYAKKSRSRLLSERGEEERQRCRDWLLKFMHDGQPKFPTKDELRQAAMRELKVSKNSFGLDFDIGLMACTRFRRHQVRCFYGTGGE
jgi:hypothetical protein